MPRAAASSTDRRFFRVHPAVCRAAPQIFARGSGLAPKTDVWVWAALHCRASQLTTEQRGYEFDREVPCLRVPYEPSEVLSVLGEQRVHSVAGAGHFTGNAWRDLGHSVLRLRKTDATFPVTVRGGRKHQRYHGPLVCLEREAREVTLTCCAPPRGGYFVLLPHDMFALRSALSETAACALLRLSYHHRGSKPKAPGAKLQHRWSVDVAPRSLGATGLIKVAPGRVSETFRRLKTALAELELAKVLALKILPVGLRLELSRDFFHCEEE